MADEETPVPDADLYEGDPNVVRDTDAQVPQGVQRVHEEREARRQSDQ